jgi:hypothetical protein
MDTTVQGHCAPSQRVIAKPKALPLKGVPNAKAAGGIPVAVGGHWVVLPSVEISGETLDGGVVSGVGVTRGADGFVVKATDGGLMPAPPISVAPNGMPTGPTEEPVPVPGEAVVTDPAEEPPAHVRDAVPPMPPPSKSAVAARSFPSSKDFRCRQTCPPTKRRMSSR